MTGQFTKNPREETLFDMCVFTCCPTFKINLFIVVVSIIDVIMFVVSLAISEKIYGDFL